MKGYYNIAGLTVYMDSWGRTVEQAIPYQIDPCDNVDIRINTSELEKEGLPIYELYPNSDEESQEYLGTGALFYRYLLNYNGFRLHSSCVVVDGRAYLFSADSGTGKSTHTKLWLKLFGNRAYILNDDKPALRLENGHWYAYGTPWSGKHDISVNKRVPVAGIAVLERSEHNEITRLFGIDAVREILKQANRPRWPEYRIKVLNLLDQIITQVPIWKLKCNMEQEAAIVSYEAMSGHKHKKESSNEN